MTSEELKVAAKIVALKRKGVRCDRGDDTIDKRLKKELGGVKSYDWLRKYRAHCKKHGLNYPFARGEKKPKAAK